MQVCLIYPQAAISVPEASECGIGDPVSTFPYCLPAFSASSLRLQRCCCNLELQKVVREIVHIDQVVRRARWHEFCSSCVRP